MKEMVLDYSAINVLPEMDITGIKRKILDVPYADSSPFQTFDLYLPDEGEGPFPLVLTIHGGGFRRGDKRDIQTAGYMKLRPKGYAIASMNYRLTHEARYPACILDCKAAVHHLKAHAAEYGIDPDRIAAAGGSAGGYLALMLAVTAGVSAFEDPGSEAPGFDSSVKCAVAMFAATDFQTMFAQVAENEKRGILNISDNSRDPNDAESPKAFFLGGAIGTLEPTYLAEASPIRYVSKTVPPLLLQHGKGDFIIPFQQSVEFFEKAVEAGRGDTTELDLFDPGLHMAPEYQTEENMTRVEKFLAKYMK